MFLPCWWQPEGFSCAANGKGDCADAEHSIATISTRKPKAFHERFMARLSDAQSTKRLRRKSPLADDWCVKTVSRSRNFQPQVFGKPFANFGGKPVMHAPCPDERDVDHCRGRWSCYGHHQPQ